jgi:nicotinamide mononucleotide (NMN) deamidase PncC
MQACGGLLSSTLLSIPGASAVFAGGQVLYTLPSRIAFADWTPEHLEHYAGPTPELVEGLCASMRRHLSTEPLSTGGAGPAGHAAKASTEVAPSPGGKAPSSPAHVEDATKLWTLGESGTAGPGRSGEGRNRTPGYVALAVLGPGGVRVSAEVETGKADRVENMLDFAAEGLELLIRAMEKAENEGKL